MSALALGGSEVTQATIVPILPVSGFRAILRNMTWKIIGAGTGAAFGMAVAGPGGAFIGAVIGALVAYAAERVFG